MDLIERRAAIDAVEFGITYAKAINKSTGEVKQLFKEGNKALNEAVERLKELPSAQPKRRPMLYRDRVMLAKNFEEWARENHVIDCPEAIICYLDIIGLIQPERKVDALDEIVRCKGCKWKQGSECVRFAEVRPFPDDFCSRAERKTDDSD